MKKSILTAVLAAACAFSASADLISPDEALARFNSGPRKAAAKNGASMSLIATGVTKSGENAYYAFSSDESTVFLSADSEALPVLGYTDAPIKSLDNVAPSTRWWLQQYARQIEHLRSIPASVRAKARKIRRAPSRRKVTYSDISPLVKTKWDQGDPYNRQCPMFNGARTYTGCVATAMAQAMYYYKYPSQSTGSNSYPWENDNGSTLSADLNTTYNWNNMLLSYSGSYTTAQANEIAKLMKNVGYSINMNYGGDDEGGSGAVSSDMIPALIDNFGYDAATSYWWRDYFTDDEWVDMLCQNLLNVGPVIYGGTGMEGGHCFILDGYRASDGFFHINWGWSGESDGYFSLDALDPGTLGAGGGDGGFNYGQDAIIGMQKPRSGSVRQKPFMAIEGYFNAKPSGRSITLVAGHEESVDDPEFDDGLGFWNTSPYAGVFNIGVQLVNQSTGATQYVSMASNQSLGVFSGYYELNFDFPSNLPNGAYTCTPVYQVDGSAWTPFKYWVRDSNGSVTLNVSGSNITVSGGTLPPFDSSMITLSLSNYDITFETGTTPTVTATFTSSYEGDAELTVVAALYDLTTDEEGFETYNFLKETVSDPIKVYMPAGGTRDYDFNVKVPASLTPGTYYLGFLEDCGNDDMFPIGDDPYVVTVKKGTAVQGSMSVTPATIWLSAGDKTDEMKRNLDVTGTNINGNITATLEGYNASDITISPTTLPAKGGRINISYKPTIKTNGTFPTITLKAANAASVTVQLRTVFNGTTTPTPAGTIAVDNEKLYFTAKSTTTEFMDKGYIGRELNVTGTGLSENITYSISGNAAADFTVSPAYLPAEGGKLAIIYKPTVTPDAYPVLTLSSKGAENKTVTLMASWDGTEPSVTPDPGPDPGPDPDPVIATEITSLTEGWIYSQTKNNLAEASWFSSVAPVTRSIAVIGDKLYVLNSSWGNVTVNVINADTGVYESSLSTQDITGGAHAGGCLAVMGNDLLLSNCARNNHDLKVYRWANGEGTPELIFTKGADERENWWAGDHFVADGTFENGLFLFASNTNTGASASQNVCAQIYDVTNNVIDPDPMWVDFPVKNGAGSAQEVKVYDNTAVWLTNCNTMPTLYNLYGEVQGTLGSAASTSNRGTSATFFDFGEHKYVAMVGTTSGQWTEGHLDLADVTDGIASPVLKFSRPAEGLGTENWGNLTNTSHVVVQLSGEHNANAKFWVMVPGQGIAHYYFKGENTSVTDIAADAADKDAPVEFYNLQGVRVSSDNLTPGLYIRRQGNKATKVILK